MLPQLGCDSLEPLVDLGDGVEVLLEDDLLNGRGAHHAGEKALVGVVPRQVLERVKPETIHEVVLEHLSVEDKIEEILTILGRENRSMAFHRLFPEQATRRVIIITLLAILELVKMKRIRIFQIAPFETIRVSPM